MPSGGWGPRAPGVAAVVAFTLFAGCSSGGAAGHDAGAGAAGGEGGTGGVTANGGTGGAVDSTGSFIGKWTFASGSFQPQCTPSVPSFGLTGFATHITQIDGTHISSDWTGGDPTAQLMCNTTCTVNGDVATAEAGQTCQFIEMVGLGGSSPAWYAVVVPVTGLTLTVSGDSLSVALTGGASSTALFTCLPTASGTATRAADGGGLGNPSVDGGAGG
jgi:hypothetical protein